MNYRAGRSPVLHSRVVQPVIAMAKDVESMIDLAIDALLSSNKELASSILQREPAVNASEMKIDAAIFAALPSAGARRRRRCCRARTPSCWFSSAAAQRADQGPAPSPPHPCGAWPAWRACM